MLSDPWTSASGPDFSQPGIWCCRWADVSHSAPKTGTARSTGPGQPARQGPPGRSRTTSGGRRSSPASTCGRSRSRTRRSPGSTPPCSRAPCASSHRSRCSSIEQITYDEYIAGLDNPTCMFMVELEPLPGSHDLRVLPEHAARAWVDHMLGGPGGKQPAAAAHRHRDPAGQQHARPRPRRTAVRVRVTSSSSSPRSSSGVEYNPQFAQAAAASDAMIVVSFEMRVGSQECIATICMPFAGLLPQLTPRRRRRRADATRSGRPATPRCGA